MDSTSAWAPLRERTFRTLWFAQLGSNVGTWMQTVAAQWLLIGHAAVLVSLVQTASLVPVLFLSLPAGVFADTVDRRRLLYVTSAILAVTVAILAGLTWAGQVSPAALLGFTFLIGCGSALTGPAWQAIQPDLVPRQQIPAASALGGITVNAARAVGPALAGVLVSLIGPAPVFALNALSFLGIAAATYAWQPPRRSAQNDPERTGEALIAGLRYLRSAPGVRRVIVRSVLFAAPASALWALLPVAAHDRYHLGAAGYGLLLGALGVGAMLGVVALAWLRAHWRTNVILSVSALAFGLATAATALAPLAITTVTLVVAGAAWIATLSTLNATLGLALPGWVRARAMGVYLLFFMGAQAIGSTGWGLVASHTSLDWALLLSAALLALAGASVTMLPLHAYTQKLDRSLSTALPEPALALDPSPTDGPLRVDITYHVPASHVDAFREAMRAVERSRRRTGARAWRLYRDGAAPDQFRETFTVRSWSEHLRQHGERLTGSDGEVLATARALADGDQTVHHLFPSDIPAPSTVDVWP